MARANPQVVKKIQNIILHPEMVPVALLQSALGFQNNNGGADGTFHRDLISHGNADFRSTLLNVVKEFREFPENAVIYIICAVLFGLPTAVYNIIYSAVNMLMVDRTHTQNINTEVVIFTKKKPLEIIDYIVNEYHRDATWWEAKGGYTEENTYMVIAVLSKYECAHLKRELKEVDEHAFVVVKDGMSVVGKYEKHLQ